MEVAQEARERRAAEDRFRVVVEASPNAVVVINRQGQIVLVNAQTEKLFGYLRDQLLGQPVEMLVPERFRSRHQDLRQGFFADPATRRMGTGRDLYGRRKNGNEFPVEIGLNPIETAGEPLVLAAIVDITERKRAEDSLRESEERFRGAFEHTNVAMVITDVENRFVRVNDAFARLFGYAPAEILRMSLADVTYSDDLAESLSQREALVAGKASFFQMEKRYLHRDGRVFWGLANISLIRDAQGRPVQYVGQVQDITEHKRAAEKFRLAVESSPNGMVMIDRHGQIALVNAQIEKLFGFTRDELLGAPIELLVPDRFRNDHPAHRDSFFANPKARSMGIGRDLHGRRKDGSEFPVEIGLNPIETDTGWMVLGAIVDITERKRAEQKLRLAIEQSEERFHLLVDSVEDYAIFMLDPDGRIATWNAGARRLKGYSAEEVIGSHFSRFYPSEDLAAGKPERELEIAREKGRVEDEGWRIKKDGSRFWANVVMTPLWERAGRLRGYAKVTRDFTERKTAQDRVNQLNDELADRISELRAVNKELESFCYSISHDLRAPLRAVDGFSRIVLKDFQQELPPEAADYLRDIRNNTLQMGRLIDDLLGFSRLSRQPLNKQPVSPAGLVQECLKDLELQREARNVDLRIGELPACQADPALLKQVWINLLSNALKYTGRRDAAVIEIGCQMSGADARAAYFVKDNGVGFDMRYAGKLFGVFQRLHRAEDYAGTGVGLAIVQRIIHRHGGKIWADARPGVGATFYFTLEGAAPDEREPH